MQTLCKTTKCVSCLERQIQRASHSVHENRITVPHRMVEKHRKAALKSATAKEIVKKKYKGPAIISCKRPEFNHYRGQTYSNFSPQVLSSGGWKHKKSNGDYFTINAYSGNPALELNSEHISSIKSFSDLGIERNIVDALKEFSITKPTSVQVETIPHILRGNNVLCAAETGSGKTLAFLIPIIQRLLQYNSEFGINNRPNTPFGIILVPSRELADQIFAVSRDLGQFIGYHSFSQCGGRRTQKVLNNRPENMMDILIATPGVLSKILTNRIYNLSRLQSVVLDEVGTLMDDSFNELVLRVLTKFNIACNTMATESVSLQEDNTDIEKDVTEGYQHEMTGLQVVLSGATVPRGLDEIAKDILPLDTLVHVKTRNLHRLMPHVSQKFCRVESADKFELLLKHVKHNVSKNMRTMVFCNKSSTARYLKIRLEENNVQTLCLHAQSSSQKRENIFEKFQEGYCNILLCTDLASRGLDTIEVHHIINYDFPHFISDYIHRAGRVGRVGSRSAGFVLNFITYKWDVDLLWNIETAARQRTELHNVNANIKRKLTNIIKEKFETEEKYELQI